MTVAIIDCGGSNLRSVSMAIKRLDMDYIVTDDVSLINSSEFVILPGVGSAQNVMQTLKSKNLIEIIKSLKQPVLGICIGMHILFEFSEEGNSQCLGIIKGKITRFNNKNLKIPQMGWNKVLFLEDELKNLDNYYYFANSFYSQIYQCTKATSNYGLPIASVVQKNNFMGCQFHPEKSANAGIKFLKYFFSKR